MAEKIDLRGVPEWLNIPGQRYYRSNHSEYMPQLPNRKAVTVSYTGLDSDVRVSFGYDYNYQAALDQAREAISKLNLALQYHG